MFMIYVIDVRSRYTYGCGELTNALQLKSRTCLGMNKMDDNFIFRHCEICVYAYLHPDFPEFNLVCERCDCEPCEEVQCPFADIYRSNENV